MPPTQVLTALLGAATIPLAGFIWITLRPRSGGILGSRALEAFAVGPVLTVVALQVALVAGLGARAVSSVALTGAAVCLVRRIRRGPMGFCRPAWHELARVLLLSAPVLLAWFWATSSAPLTGDPAELWAAKAAAFKHAGALDLSPLGAPEAVARRNPLHPVGFPLLMVQTLAWLPRFEPMLCRIPSVWFLLVLIVATDRALSGLLRPWPRAVPVLALALLPPVLGQGSDGHADLALGVVLLASWLALAPPPNALLAGVLCGGAALMKLEGVAAPLVGALLLVAQGRWRRLARFAAGAAVPLAFARLVLPSGSGSVPMGLLDPRLYLEHGDVLRDRLGFIARELWGVLRGLPVPALVFACVLGGASLLATRARAAGPRGVSRTLLLAAAMWLACVSAAYLLHPQFEFQVRAHQARALLQVLPALWIAGSIAVFAVVQPAEEESPPP